MLFGLNNVLGRAQRAFNVLLTKVRWQLAFVVLHDIVVFCHTPDEHIDHVRQVLMILHDTCVTLIFRKGKLSRNHINYLGRVILCRRREVLI